MIIIWLITGCGFGGKEAAVASGGRLATSQENFFSDTWTADTRQCTGTIANIGDHYTAGDIKAVRVLLI